MSCPPASILGSIEVTAVTNGIAPFTYVLKNTVTNVTLTHVEPARANYIFSGLSFGNYALTVTDSKGCSVTQTKDVLAPPTALIIDISTPVVSCASGATIIVSINPTPVPPGTPYTFGIYDMNVAPFSSALLPSDLGFPLQHTFTGLTPGVVYTFVIFDNITNCYYFQKATGPIPPLTPLISAIDVVKPVTCKGTSTGKVSFTVSNYSGTSIDYEVFYDQTNLSTGITGHISTAAPTSVTPIIVPALGTLTPGTYYIKFKELDGANTGCISASATFTITESAVALTATATADKKDNCNHTGQISAIAQGGTLPYQYELVGPVNIGYSNFSTFPNASSPLVLTTGNYTVNIKDANGCVVSKVVFLDIDPTPVVAAVLNNQCTATEGNFVIDVTLPTAGIAPYSYSVDGG
ncbi:chromophore lyase, partial [Flavobacterium sp. ZT3R18]